MTLVGIVLDGAVQESDRSRGAGSVLDLPLPSESLLEFHCRQLRAVSVERIVVVRCEVGPIAPRLARSPCAPVSFLDRAAWAKFVDESEPGDMFLLLDGRIVLPGVNGPEPLLSGGCFSHVRHLLSHARTHGAIEELAELNESWQLRRLHRRFPGLTHLSGGVLVASLLPAGILRDAMGDELPELASLRSRLAGLGVPAMDIASGVTAVDASRPTGALELMEHQLVARDLDRDPRGRREPATRAAIAPDARIDPTARLVGAVSVHAGARLDAGCRIIGPAVIGSRARIGAGALLSRVCVWPDARVEADARVVEQIVIEQFALPRERASDPPLTLPEGLRRAPQAMGSWSCRGKRIADILLSVAGLIVLAPLLALVAALIKLTSPGPILFGHEREGRQGRRFQCWKFRTMVRDAHSRQRELYARNDLDGPQFKLAHDPRVTRIGDFLRKTNLDELPQLFNVLRGEMSLIGPRPSPFRENQVCIPWRKTRLAVRPGITGLWQICRHDRGESDFYQWIYFDTLYVQHQSVRLDLLIILVTALTLGGRWPIPVDWLIPAAGRAASSAQRGRPRSCEAAARQSAPPALPRRQRGESR